jgi:hypothetical protein
MNYTAVINHIQRILNNCGDPVILTPTGKHAPHDSGQISIEIRKVAILQQNNCCTIPPPSPSCADNPVDKYWINHVRISPSLMNDYSKNDSWTDDEIKKLICKKEFLFGCFEDTTV